MEMYLDTVRAAIDAGVRFRCHFEDITRADFDGFVLPFAEALMKLGESADTPVKIRMCDTMGFGVPWEEAALPRSVPKIVDAFRRKLGVPPGQLEWHGHNDFHLGVANSVTAWLYGCSVVNGSFFSMGERTGNTPIEAMAVHYAQIKGEDSGINFRVINEMADYCRKDIGLDIPTNYPLCGRDFNVTRAGIHADGLLKQEEIYNPFDTDKILSRPVGVAITDKSGLAGIKHWIEHRFDVEDLRKDDPRLVAINQKVQEEYDTQRTSAISDEEMTEWVREAFGEELRRLR
jgi:isopropylmalate/homocitrate/citramalate synthase